MTPHPSAPDVDAPGEWAMPPPRPGRPWLVPAGITLAWATWVVFGGHAERVGGHWATAATLSVGSVVAGATPLGGTAIGFGPLTRVLGLAAAPARTLALAVQAVGLGTLAAMVALSGASRVQWRLVWPAAAGGAVGMLLGLLALTDRASAFDESLVPAPHLAVAFSIAVAVLTASVLLAMRRRASTDAGPHGAVLVLAGVVGGTLASLTGSGVGVATVAVVVVAVGRGPRVGVPVAIVAMGIVAAGAVLLATTQGQFAVDLDAVGQVVAVGGHATPPLDPARYDLFGMLLAAVPVVAWVVPLATHLAARASRRAMATVVAAAGLAELAWTALTLPALREDATVRTVALVGLPAALALVALADRRGRHEPPRSG